MNIKNESIKSGRILIILIMIIIIINSSYAEQYGKMEMIEKSKACLECHDDKLESLAGSTHHININGEPGIGMAVGCIGCHKGWEKHLDEPSAETIVKLSNLSLSEQSEVCGNCHVGQHQTRMISTDPHGRAGVSCLSCHKIHDNDNKNLLQGDSENFCLGCHKTIGDEFNRRTRHPLESGNIKCVDCHALGDAEDPSLIVGIDWKCQNCHADISGPYIHEHPVVYSHLVNGGGCIECHEPHGSPNERLLKQSGNGICIQCHGIPPGHRTKHSGWGMKSDCVLCHTDIHGSNNNDKFLDPDLATKFVADCNQSGCHSLDN
jgi:DmsE family decaheme c-type cytochrome